MSEMRVGQPMKENSKLRELSQEIHAESQEDLVNARSYKRRQERTGTHTADFGKSNNDITSQLNNMDMETLESHIRNRIKSFPRVLSIAVYKDNRVAEQDFQGKHCRLTTETLPDNVIRTTNRIAERMARDLNKKNVVGVIAYSTGNYVIVSGEKLPPIPPTKILVEKATESEDAIDLDDSSKQKKDKKHSSPVYKEVPTEPQPLIRIEYSF
jgi:hypothetical protein